MFGMMGRNLIRRNCNVTLDQCDNELVAIAEGQAANARALALSCILEFNPNRSAELSDVLLLKFRDMPVDNEIASFIFDELARDVLRRRDVA